MFLPLASTMSVFNCRAVGAHAEKTFTGSRQVWGRTEGGLGKRTAAGLYSAVQSSEFPYEVSPFRNQQGNSLVLPVFLTPLTGQVQTGDPKALFLCEVWSAARKAPWVPIPASPEWWDQLSNLFLVCSLTALTHCFAEGWPDSPRFSTAAVVLRQAAVFTPLISCSYSCAFPPLSVSPHP